MRERHKFKDRDMQLIIGWLLRLGVIISVSIVIFGGIVYLLRHGQITADYTTFRGVPDFIYPPGIIRGIFDFKARAIIQAGIILLIATPVLRVIFSAIGFLIEKDYLYIAISLLVLLIIICSMFSG
jgi:uncharacterized membrane protein